MSLTRYALTRYKAIDRCLKSKHRIYDFQKLKEAVDEALYYEYGPDAPKVSRRQLYYDLLYMQSETGYDMFIEQERKGRKVVYYYPNEGQSIYKSPITEEELGQIGASLSILSRVGGNVQADWIRNLMMKLRNEQLIQQKPSDAAYIILEENSFYEGNEWLEPLFQHCVARHVLKIAYKPYFSEKEKIILHPYFLKAYNLRWYLFGWSDKHHRIINLALDRIEQVAIETAQSFNEAERPLPDEYFEDMIGVTKYDNAKAFIVKALISPELYPYIKTKPLHGSQKELSADVSGRKSFQWEIIINLELIQKLLSYGSDLEVLEPAELRELMKEKIKQMASLYA